MTTQVDIARRYTRTDKWAYGLFWSWNLIFIAFILLGFAPEIAPFLIRATRSGQVPLQYIVYFITLVSVPFLAVVLGLTVLRREPSRLFALGYAIEGPLMLLLLVRFFLIREATPVVDLLSVIAVIGMSAFVWYLLDRRSFDRPVFIRYLKVFGLTLFMLLVLYASVWVAFYAIPLLMFALRAIYTFLLDIGSHLGYFWTGLTNLFKMGSQIVFSILGFLLLIYTGTLMVLMPVAVPVLAVRAWLSELRAIPSYPARQAANALSGVTVILVIILMVLAAQQPQHRAFALLEEPPQTHAEAKTLMRQQETIRRGLLNAYLAPVRYLSSVGDVWHIREIYMGAFKISEQTAWHVQNVYEWVVRPLLYEPVEPVEPLRTWENRPLQQEPFKAAQLYETFFDEPIHVAERDTVVRAVRSTWNAEQAQAAWQAVDDREIHLGTQEITIQEQGDWAEIEVYEVYYNQTRQQQEVIYYFSLPESAVLTGVWLNDRPGKGGRFEYQVAPRGAAQAIYRNEKVVRQDPALLEQIGPRQYRLRIFPVEPQRWVQAGNWDEGVFEDRPLYMWMTFRVLQQNGEWPLPRLAEVRNVYWDEDTQRSISGQPFAGEDWMPAVIPASNSVTTTQHRFTFVNGETILALPYDPDESPTLPANVRLALVLDRSRSMLRHAADVQNAMLQLKQLEDQGAHLDVYLTASIYRGEPASVSDLQSVLDEEILYFGGQNAAELLSQYQELSQGKSYDAVLMLTDGSGYELGASAVPNEITDAPLWLVHINGDFPLGYDDDTLEAIQASGGGVTGSLDEAFTRIAASLDAGETVLAGAGIPLGSSQVDIIDGYAWVSLPAGSAGLVSFASPSSDDFAPFAARRVILAEMQRSRGSLEDIAVLDDLHAIAVEHHVVTPYSSMIVLVNAQQRRNLEMLEGQADRFDREFEGSGDTVPQAFTVTGVPEPEEWLLMALAVGLLGWYYRKSLKQRLHFGGQGGMRLG
jgi:putative PEP-CTERM system integral membrane protein